MTKLTLDEMLQDEADAAKLQGATPPAYVRHGQPKVMYYIDSDYRQKGIKSGLMAVLKGRYGDAYYVLENQLFNHTDEIYDRFKDHCFNTSAEAANHVRSEITRDIDYYNGLINEDKRRIRTRETKVKQLTELLSKY